MFTLPALVYFEVSKVAKKPGERNRIRERGKESNKREREEEKES